MHKICELFLLSGFIPIVRAWFVSKCTSLRSTIVWAALALLGWVASAGAMIGNGPIGPYLALSLTACVGVSVLGARQPGAKAWNCIVLSLLVILLWPLVEGLGELRIALAHLIFLGALLGVLIVNYLPTCLGFGAALLGIVCAFEISNLHTTNYRDGVSDWLILSLGIVPWLGSLIGSLRPTNLPEVDRKWLRFRDSYGLVWGRRQQEQFNRSAENSGWSVRLGWGGLRRISEAPPPSDATISALLSAVVKRFGTFDDSATSTDQ